MNLNNMQTAEQKTLEKVMEFVFMIVEGNYGGFSSKKEAWAAIVETTEIKDKAWKLCFNKIWEEYNEMVNG